MARVSGKCPVCGEVIHVNDEKEIGHCGKCGAQINVSESIQLFQTSPSPAPTSVPQQTVVSTSQRNIKREQREREAEAKMQVSQAKQRIHDMFQQCSDEQSYLSLRPKIMEMDISDSEKARLLEALDNATKERLKVMLEKAQAYEESQESPLNLIVGVVALIGIGLAVNHFFSKKWVGIVIIILAIMGLIGGLGEKFDKKKIAENKAAANLIAEYRKMGYKI